MVGSIDPRCETLRGTHWPVKVAGVFGTRVAENHLGQRSPAASTGRTYGCKRSDQTIEKLLQHGGRPHMGPCFRRDDVVRECVFAISRREATEVCGWFLPHPQRRRVQGMPGARCTRGLVCKMHIEERTRAYRFSGDTPAFPAQWLYGLCRALLGDEFVLPPSLAD